MTMYHPFADSICMNLGEPYSLSLLYHKRLSTGNLWSSSQYSSNNAWNVNNENNRRQRVGATPKHTVGKRVDVCSSASRY